MKKKYSGVVYKRRVPMELVSAVLYLNNGILPESENQIFREIQYMKQRYHLEPAAYVLMTAWRVTVKPMKNCG